MKPKNCRWQTMGLAGVFLTCLSVTTAFAFVTLGNTEASIFTRLRCRHGCQAPGHAHGGVGDLEMTGEPGGSWYWMRSPDEEKRVIIGQYNRYCIRCHGVDGRGVWDIPDVPDFTNARWQASRSDLQIARATLEGRGAVMPPFRGTLTLEEAWAMARYLRTFIPGSESPRPDREPAEEIAPAPKSMKQPAKQSP